MSTVRIGIIGVGSIGLVHLQALRAGKIPGATVTAIVCRAERAAQLGDLLDSKLARFDDAQALYGSGRCDAVIIASPHPFHASQTIAALRAGLHVLCEKPAGITAAEARAMAAVARETGRLYALNFNRRSAPLYAWLRNAVHDGTLGELRRFSWTSTIWLRNQVYFENSSWRGTWAGEGGGLLLNQLPHTLDLWTWIFGLPTRVWATCGFGRYHQIEVEDEIHAIAEYGHGAKAVFIASTGEAPGSERLEIVGDRATIIAEKNRVTITRLPQPLGEFMRVTSAPFAVPETTTEVLEVSTEWDYMERVIGDFVARIGDGGPPLASGEEGIASLELANAILLSAWQQRWVELPLDEAEFDRQLRARRS